MVRVAATKMVYGKDLLLRVFTAIINPTIILKTEYFKVFHVFWLPFNTFKASVAYTILFLHQTVFTPKHASTSIWFVSTNIFRNQVLCRGLST